MTRAVRLGDKLPNSVLAADVTGATQPDIPRPDSPRPDAPGPDVPRPVGMRPGNMDPRALAATRVQLHHLAVLVSGVGRTLARRQTGYLHASLRWDAELGGLAGWPVDSPSGGLVRAALVFGPPRVLLLDSRDGPQRVWIDVIGSRFAKV